MADVTISRVLEIRRALSLSTTQAAILAICLDNPRVERSCMATIMMALGAYQKTPAFRAFDVQLCRVNKVLETEGARIDSDFVAGTGHRAKFYWIAPDQRAALIAKIHDANYPAKRAA